MSQPTVSVIMRTRDRPALLPRAFGSVLGQGLRDWELLVVNDGGAREPVEDLIATVQTASGGRIRAVHRDVSSGMEAASNAGISAATGRYLVIHDDDDSWNPDFLEACVGYLENVNDPSVQGVISHTVRVNERIDASGISEIDREPYNPGLTSVSLFKMCARNLFPPISFLYRRSALETIGPYSEELPVLGDWEFNLRFLAHFDIGVIPKQLAHYHYRVRLMNGTYSNTVVGGLDLHSRYDMSIRNGLLRRDLRQGKIGLGLLVNLAQMLDDRGASAEANAAREVQTKVLAETAVRLRRLGTNGLCVYGAGEVGKSFGRIAASMGLAITSFVDSNSRLWGSRVQGVEVVSLDKALERGLHRFVIASFAFSREIRETIIERCRELGIDPTINELIPEG